MSVVSLYLQMWTVSKTYLKKWIEVNKDFWDIDFYQLGFVITLNVDFVKKNPIEEDQTEQKFLINLEQVFDQNHFKCGFYKKSSWSKLIDIRNLIFEISDQMDFLVMLISNMSKKPKFVK